MSVTGFSATNYASTPDHADFTVPAGVFTYLVFVKPTDVVGGKDIYSTREWGIASSCNFYQFDTIFGFKLGTLTSQEVTGAANGTWTILAGGRTSGNSVNIRIVNFGSTTVTSSAGVTDSSSYDSPEVDIKIGRRQDTGTNPFIGSISDVLLVPGSYISDADLQAIATGTAIDSFSWYTNRVFWWIASTSSGNDQTGNHFVTVNGTLTSDTDPSQLVRFGAITVVIGQTTETNTTQTITHIKTGHLNQATKTDTAQIITPSKTQNILQSSETDTAQILTPSFANVINQAVEVDTAQFIGTPIFVQIGQALETDSAQNIGAGIFGTINPALETNTAQVLILTKTGAPVIIIPTIPGSDMFMIADDVTNTATITATSTASGFTTDNLQTSKKSEIWASSSLADQTITYTWATAQSISGLGIAFSNLVSGDTVRLKIYTNSGDSVPAYDSGDMTVNFAYNPPEGFSTIGLASYAFGGGNYFSALFSSVSGQKAEVILSSPANPDSRVEVAKIILGHAITPKRGASLNATISHDDSTSIEELDNGDDAISRGFIKKVIEFNLSSQEKNDKLALMQAYRRNGMSMPVFVSAHQNDSNPEGVTSFTIYGYFQQIPSASLFLPDLYSSQITIKEV